MFSAWWRLAHLIFTATSQARHCDHSLVTGTRAKGLPQPRKCGWAGLPTLAVQPQGRPPHCKSLEPWEGAVHFHTSPPLLSVRTLPLFKADLAAAKASRVDFSKGKSHVSMRVKSQQAPEETKRDKLLKLENNNLKLSFGKSHWYSLVSHKKRPKVLSHSY